MSPVPPPEDTNIKPSQEVPAPAPPAAPQSMRTPPLDLGSLLRDLLPFADRYLKLQEGKQRHEQALEQAQSESSWKVLAILIIFLGVIIAVMSWLTFADKVSGDALLFLVGTVAGYVLAIVQRHLFPETIEVNTDN